MSSAAVTGEETSALREVDLSVRGMTCAACAARVEKKLNAITSVSATVNLATERATVTAPESVPVQVLIDAVEHGRPVACPLDGVDQGLHRNRGWRGNRGSLGRKIHGRRDAGDRVELLLDSGSAGCARHPANREVNLPECGRRLTRNRRR